jgi:hypothetical protein
MNIAESANGQVKQDTRARSDHADVFVAKIFVKQELTLLDIFKGFCGCGEFRLRDEFRDFGTSTAYKGKIPRALMYDSLMTQIKRSRKERAALCSKEPSISSLVHSSGNGALDSSWVLPHAGNEGVSMVLGKDKLLMMRV